MESLNLRDLLKEQDDCETRSKRTLLDIINEEQARAYSNNGSNKIKWKSFKTRLKPRRSASCGSLSSCSSQSNPIPVDHISTPVVIDPNSAENEPDTIQVGNGNILQEYDAGDSIQTVDLRVSTSLRAALTAEREWSSMENGEEVRTLAVPTVVIDEIPIVSDGTQADSAPPVRVSLMALLEQADRPAAAAMAAGLGGEEEVAEEQEEEEGGVEYVCCVCMVRHKKAAFIPCGHTFCRRCSREVWVNRGSCPLCNGYILEILDIF